ncbi:MAG: hypothetical protein O2921_01675, partial [Chloroflexi bacterium]|nr:hypothetical protein [Chloroflexota bacterium]
ASHVTSGTSARDIVTDSNVFIVTVVDTDENATTTITSNETGSGGFAPGTPSANVVDVVGTGFNLPGERVNLILADEAANPVVGTLSDIKILKHGTSTVVSNISVIAIAYAGNGTNPPIITIQLDFGAAPATNLNVRYPSSATDAVTASIKSVVDPAGTVVTLTETGRNTGRFEGYVKVVQYATSGTGKVTVGSPGGTEAAPAVIPALAGPISVSYNDKVTSGTATNVARPATYNLDTTSPTASVSAPAHKSETQNRKPTFTGNMTDNQAGLDVSTFELRIDQNNDASNTGGLVITPGDTNTPIGTRGTAASVNLGTAADGVSTLAFTHTPTADIPTAVNTPPNHIVDFQVRVADMAGNYGYSDADTAKGNDGTGRHGNQPNTVKVDQLNPSISTAETGIGLNTTVSPSVEKENVRDTIKVTFDGNVKESSVSVSDFQIKLGPNGTGATLVPASLLIKDNAVYLDLDATIPSDNKPTVSIQGTIQDIAGNSTDIGSKIADDKLDPVITVTLSGGSGTGTGDEAADKLTKANMTITVSSDENLQSPPAFTVDDISSAIPGVKIASVHSGTFGVALGGNSWNLVVAKGSSSDGARGLQVAVIDTAGNSGTSGLTSTKAYTLDTSVAAPTSTPANAGSTTQSNPFITSDYSTNEKSSLTVVSATLDAVDVTSQVVASANSKTFFFQPLTALTNAEHTYVIKVKDAAGNDRTTTTKFTKTNRTDFVVQLFAGWNSVSVPSNPLDTDVNSVLSNSGIKQVVAYDATTPSQPWRIASKVGAAAYTSQTIPGLTSVTAGPGYWIETVDFEDQKVALEGPTGPSDARPGLTTIATGNGWNLVGVVDQSRSQTQKNDAGDQLTREGGGGEADVLVTSETYFNTVNNGRAYTFDTVTSKFKELVSSNGIVVGTGIWVFISPQANGQLPHIVP